MARKYGVAFDKSVKKKLEQEKLSHLANHSSHVAERGLSFLFLVKLSGFQKCKGKNNRQEEKRKEKKTMLMFLLQHCSCPQHHQWYLSSITIRWDKLQTPCQPKCYLFSHIVKVKHRQDWLRAGLRACLCPRPAQPDTESPSLPGLTPSQRLWTRTLPEEGVHTPTHPHSSLLFNCATPLSCCIAGRPPSFIISKQYSMCVEL